MLANRKRKKIKPTSKVRPKEGGERLVDEKKDMSMKEVSRKASSCSSRCLVEKNNDVELEHWKNGRLLTSLVSATMKGVQKFITKKVSFRASVLNEATNKFALLWPTLDRKSPPNRIESNQTRANAFLNEILSSILRAKGLRRRRI